MSEASAAQVQSIDATAGPSIAWLAMGFLLAGLGTVMLGPILPSLLHDWQLTDQQGGLLLAAKFVGSFLGGVSVPRRLRFGVFGGMCFACLGFGAFALIGGLHSGALCLFVGGFGLGQIIASTNIVVGRRYQKHTGSALASVNFFWSLGAVACGLVAAAILPRFHLRGPLLCFAGLFLIVGIGGYFMPLLDGPKPLHLEAATPSGLPHPILLHFALLLFLYGGLETCMTGWLTTYTLRFSDVRLLGGQSAIVLLWSALTAGRAISSASLRVMSESTLQRIGLLLSAVFIAALLTTHHAALLSLYCVLLGLSLAPFFPATFALLIHWHPTAREAGFILAVSGLGAALFPWIMGYVSTHSGSLRIAMVVPLLLTLALLALSSAANSIGFTQFHTISK
ncbi:MAG: MFS transporter [Acidobacteria bacterium]|nr:MFS transporter [Acidobacteriota bacterium]